MELLTHNTGKIMEKLFPEVDIFIAQLILHLYMYSKANNQLLVNTLFLRRTVKNKHRELLANIRKCMKTR